MSLVPLSLLVLLFYPALLLADPIPVTVPTSPASTHVVRQNFLGISLELSYLDEYFGNDTSTIPTPMLNYLAAICSRIGSNNPLRLRIGGNSMDTSKYLATMGAPMIQRVNSPINGDNQPANYGPVVWDVLSKVSSGMGGAAFVIGLSLINPNDPVVPVAAADALSKLGSSLDAFLLGNEPDVYATHGFRSSNTTWTEASYIADYKTASSHLSSTSDGNILGKHILAGPAICCRWTLDTLIKDGYISEFGNNLKYIALQHYPLNNCFGPPKGNLSYFVRHSNVVQLGTWQKAGIDSAISKGEQVIMSEFNSVSCGGFKTISDTFAAGSLWTVDYALQLASVGYSAIHVHTRERGISYNVMTPPGGPVGAWTTNPPFYAVLATAEALRSKNGAIVVDLKLGSNKSEYAGYAVYDSKDKTVQQLVFFNYANVTSSAKEKIAFRLSASTFSSSTRMNVTVKYLVGDSMSEDTNIGWGGETYAGVGDGKLIKSSATWAPANLYVDCSKGCEIDVPAPGMAVAFAGGSPTSTDGSDGTGTSSSTTSDSVPLNFHVKFHLAMLMIAGLWLLDLPYIY